MVRDPKLKKIALWTYFKSAKRDPGLDEGGNHGCLPTKQRLVLVYSIKRRYG
jgi:hypothetical protein